LVYFSQSCQTQFNPVNSFSVYSCSITKTDTDYLTQYPVTLSATSLPGGTPILSQLFFYVPTDGSFTAQLGPPGTATTFTLTSLENPSINRFVVGPPLTVNVYTGMTYIVNGQVGSSTCNFELQAGPCYVTIYFDDSVSSVVGDVTLTPRVLKNVHISGYTFSPSTLTVPTGSSSVSFLIYGDHPLTIFTQLTFRPSIPIYDYASSTVLTLNYRDSVLTGGAISNQDFISNMRSIPGDKFPIPLVFGIYFSNEQSIKEVPNKGQLSIKPHALSSYVLMDYPSVSDTEFGKDSEVGVHGYGRYGFVYHVDSGDNAYSIPSVSFTNGVVGNLLARLPGSTFPSHVYLEVSQTKYIFVAFSNFGTYDIGTYNLTFFIGGGSSSVTVSPSVVNVTNGLNSFVFALTGTVAGSPAFLRIATSKADILEAAIRFAVGASVTVYQINPGPSFAGAGGLIRIAGPTTATVIFQAQQTTFNVTSESLGNKWGNAITMTPGNQYSYYIQGGGPNLTYTVTSTDGSTTASSLISYTQYLYCCQSTSAGSIPIISMLMVSIFTLIALLC